MTTSNQILTDLQSAITTGPTDASLALASAAAGPITDLKGQLENTLLQAQELKTQINTILAVLDGSDPIKSTVTNVRDTFV